MWLQSFGTFRYSPKAKSIPSKKWWLVIDCCPELARYYRNQWNFAHRFGTRRLYAPAWGAHISVIADELPPASAAAIKDGRQDTIWESHAGEQVKFEYEPKIATNGQYYWLAVRCERALDLRDELGLSREPFYPLHLTIGIDFAWSTNPSVVPMVEQV
jgi:hypothetical protein